MFCDNLKAQRLKNGLSQKQVADSLCVSSQSISKWEKGDALPSIEFLPRLAQCLNCDINTFFADEEKESINYATISKLFALMRERYTNGTSNAEEIAEYLLENPSVIDTAIQICTDLMGRKCISIKNIRVMLNCSDAEAREFVGCLEQYEALDKLETEDTYYVVKDAVEGFIVVMKIQKQLSDVINKWK